MDKTDLINGVDIRYLGEHNSFQSIVYNASDHSFEISPSDDESLPTPLESDFSFNNKINLSIEKGNLKSKSLIRYIINPYAPCSHFGLEGYFRSLFEYLRDLDELELRKLFDDPAIKDLVYFVAQEKIWQNGSSINESLEVDRSFESWLEIIKTYFTHSSK